MLDKAMAANNLPDHQDMNNHDSAQKKRLHTAQLLSCPTSMGMDQRDKSKAEACESCSSASVPPENKLKPAIAINLKVAEGDAVPMHSLFIPSCWSSSRVEYCLSAVTAHRQANKTISNNIGKT